MDSGYSKISRHGKKLPDNTPKRGLGIIPSLLIGALVGLVLGAGATFAFIVSTGTGLSPADAVVIVETVSISQVVTVETIIEPTQPPTDTLPSITPTLSPTMTLTPTVEPPTPTPSPTPDLRISITIQNETNIRYGPGTDYPIVGVAQGGDQFQITGYHTQFPWLQIRFDESPTNFAWVLQDIVDVTGNIYELQPISNTVLNLPTLTPTPSIAQSSSGLSGETVSLSPPFQALGNQLWDVVLTAGFDPRRQRFASLFLLDLQTGEAITFGGDIAYSGTSINKVPALVGLYRALSAPPNQTLSTDIANMMICSNNTTTNRVLSTIGSGDEWAGTQLITDTLGELGLDDTFLLAPYTILGQPPPTPPAPIPVPDTDADQVIAAPEPYNQLTVEDLGWLLSSIYQCGYEESGALLTEFEPSTFEPRECRQILHVMSTNDVDNLLRSGVPATTRFAHKHGWINDTHINAAVVFTPGGNYVIVMAAHTNQINPVTGQAFLEFGLTQPIFGEVSRLVYNYYNPSTPLAAPREPGNTNEEIANCNFAEQPIVGDLMQFTWDD